MELLVLNQTEVAELLPMRECIEVVGSALAALSRGRARQPLRTVMPLGHGRGVLATMPGYLESTGSLGLKVISVFPANEGTEFDSHQGAILLFETTHGRPLALIDATEVTAVRTAAATAVATRALAREAARTLAILGSGVQARTHLEAMLCVRPIDHVSVWSRHAEHAREFARRAVRRHDVAVEAVASVEAALDEARVVCVATAASEPILRGALLVGGMHVNAVGASVPSARELDTEAVVRSRLFVDRRESALAESGDVLIPLRDGAIDESHIVAEIGEVLIGRHPGRSSPSDITLFESLGLAVEDLAAAELVYRKAVERGLGQAVELGGGRRN